MFMKKFFVSMLVAGLLMFSGSAMADMSGGPGAFIINADANSVPVGSCDIATLPKHSGMAFGVGGAVGTAGADAFGGIIMGGGTVSGYVTSNSAAFVTVDEDIASRWYNPVPGADKSIGVKSRTTAIGNTGASVDVTVDLAGGFGMGTTMGSISGFAAQGTLNGSIVGKSPLSGWTETEGFSGGIAGQGSAGGFVGGAFVLSIGMDTEDSYYRSQCNDRGKCTGYFVKTNGKNAGEVRWFDNKKPREENPNWEYLGSEKREGNDINANAGANAQINMDGGSYSGSYRYINDIDGSHTEGMGTEVGAWTNVESYGNSYEDINGCGLSIAEAGVEGGYMVAGGAATHTYQTLPDGSSASASAVGFYAGSGVLGDSFTGSVEGYSSTSMTTVSGMKGSASMSSAGMSVTTTSGDGQLQVQ